MGFDVEALRRRLGKGAKVTIEPVEADDVPDVQELRATTPRRSSAPIRQTWPTGCTR